MFSTWMVSSPFIKYQNIGPYTNSKMQLYQNTFSFSFQIYVMTWSKYWAKINAAGRFNCIATPILRKKIFDAQKQKQSISNAITCCKIFNALFTCRST